MQKTKMIFTIGPASDNETMLPHLLEKHSILLK